MATGRGEVGNCGTDGVVVEVLENAVAHDEVETSGRCPSGDVCARVPESPTRVVADVGGHELHLRMVRAVPIAPVTRPCTDVEKRTYVDSPPRSERMDTGCQLVDLRCRVNGPPSVEAFVVLGIEFVGRHRTCVADVSVFPPVNEPGRTT